jgi:hypothetical protein
MLRYVKIDGKKLDFYYDELREKVSCIKDFSEVDGFYSRFKSELLSGLSFYDSVLDFEEQNLVQNVSDIYKSKDFVMGKPDWPSKGNCDIIEGSGLEGLVKYS